MDRKNEIDNSGALDDTDVFDDVIDSETADVDSSEGAVDSSNDVAGIDEGFGEPVVDED